MIYFVAFFLSGISMLYEFTLAQLVALFFGSTFEIYALTIGLYTFSLGMGALYYEKRKESIAKEELFFRTELALIGSALLAPFLIIFLSTPEVSSQLGSLAKAIAFVPIVAFGWLSGVELPSMLSLASDESDHEVLFSDYIGMFLGSVLFSTVLMDSLGPLNLIWCLSLANALILMSYMVARLKQFGRTHFVLISIFMVFVVTVLIREAALVELFKGLHHV